MIITLHKTNRNSVITFFLSADAIWAEGFFNASTAWEQMANTRIRKESEPGAVDVLMAAL